MPYAYTVTATDPDLSGGDALTLTAPTLPAWLSLADQGDGAGLLSGLPSILEVGNHAVVLQVRDRDGLTDTQAFTLTVTLNDEIPPEVVATSPPSEATDATLGAPVVITFSEAISASTFAYAVNPDPGGWSALWSGDGTVVTLSHAPFAYQTRYTATVTAVDDLAGNSLALPYTWSFTTLAQPITQYRIYLPVVVRSS